MDSATEPLTRRQWRLLTDIAALPEGASYAALERDPDICALVQNDLVAFENTRPGVGTVQITSFGRSALHHRVPMRSKVNRRPSKLTQYARKRKASPAAPVMKASRATSVPFLTLVCQLVEPLC